MIKSKEFQIALFRLYFRVIIGSCDDVRPYLIRTYPNMSKESLDAVLDSVNGVVTKHDGGATMTIVDSDYVQNFIIWLPIFDGYISDYDTLSHEMYHLTSIMLRSRGIEESDESHECFAYTQGYITRMVFNWLDSIGVCKFNKPKIKKKAKKKVEVKSDD